jgi:uncharacterized protein YbjT (DUF2867 family)
MTTVLVTGGRGKTGREVVRLLAERPDASVRAGSRDPSTLAANGADPVKFEWEDPKTWADALRGVDAVYLVRPEIEEAPELIGAFLEAAEGVEHVALLSEQGADGLPSSSWERRVEEAVSDGAKASTVLRCSVFHQVLGDGDYMLFGIRDEDGFEWPTAGAAIGFIDTRDIADVAIEAMLGRGHDGQTYTLTGPEMLTAALGRPIKHVEQPIDECLAGFFGPDADPSWLSSYYEGVFERICAGVFAEVTDSVEEVIGREPRPIGAYISEHTSLWVTPAPASP